ncbi:MAG: phospholipase [Geminicoccaceae bacterium]|nr:phospholipase [Geminicoccaceae bacterium]
MKPLDGPRRAPRSGQRPKQLVVLLHGVGADGNDLIGLVPAIAPALPDAAFVAPDAPEPYDMAPFGRQWFSLQDRTLDSLLSGVRRAGEALDAFLDAELERHGLDDQALVLAGFSQGTMTALHVGLRRARPPAAIVGFSGALLGGELLAQEIVSRPPVFLAHGDQDPVVPVQALHVAVAALEAVDVPVRWSVRPGVAHGIDPGGLAKALQFLGEVLEPGARG